MRFNYKWVIAICLLLGLADAWWEHSNSKDRSGDEALIEAIMNEPLQVRAREGDPRAAGVTETASAPAAANWRAGVSDVFSSGASTSEQARSLLAQFPNLPPAGQFETAHHICNLLPDDSYSSWAAYLTNTTTTAEVRNVIFADLLQRPNSIKLPLLVQLARASASPKAADAAQLLRATLREDYGTNWDLWQSKVQAWLKANPDPARPGISGTL